MILRIKTIRVHTTMYLNTWNYLHLLLQLQYQCHHFICDGKGQTCVEYKKTLTL